MNVAAQPLPRRPAERGMRPSSAMLVAALTALIAVSLAVALYRYPPTLLVVLAGSLGLGSMVTLALARYEAAVALGFVLLGLVRVEPAPSDGVFAMVIALALVTGRFDISRVPLAAFALVGLLLGLNLLSAVEALDPAVAARYFTITLYLAVFAIWFTGYLHTKARARLVTVSYVIGAVVVALPSTLALFAPIPGGELLLSADGLRAQGLFKDPNVYGPFLIPPALILLEELIRPRLLRFRTTTKAIMFMVLLVGVLFSYSRAAWVSTVVAVAVMLAVMALRRGGGRRAATILVVLALAAGFSVMMLALTSSVGFLEERASFQSYDVERFGAQRTGIALAERYPFGIGPGQFELVSEVSTHSTYIRVLAEQGVLGLVVVLSLVIFTLVLASRNAVLGRSTYGIGSAALLAIWVGLMVNSFVV
ncbi:MAG TPA: O-antigen ligase family protein, partial [Thermoleophilaceae bacterium]|nr:O-antigen ligase family protein [Thermoleophilaceae bacterium]